MDEENKRLRDELVNERVKRLCAERDLAKKDAELAKKGEELAKKDTELANVRREAEVAKKEVEKELVKKGEELVKKGEELGNVRRDVENLRAALADKRAEIANKNTEIARKEGEVNQVKERLTSVAAGTNLTFALVKQSDEQHQWLEMICGQPKHVNDSTAVFEEEDVVLTGVIGAPIPLRNRLRENLIAEMKKRTAVDASLSVRLIMLLISVLKLLMFNVCTGTWTG